MLNRFAKKIFSLDSFKYSTSLNPNIGSGSLLSGKINNIELLVINRAKALNTLNSEICESLRQKLSNMNSDPPDISCFMLKGAGDKAFCAGGDVKSVVNSLAQKDNNQKEAYLFFPTEYKMNYELSVSKVPQVSIWDGVVMGGGVGISIFGKYRIATEKTIFAMPETAIGLFPDVGSSYWLSRLDNGFGYYIGLTGCRLKYRDLIELGIATHYVSSKDLESLEKDISDNMPPYSDKSHSILDGIISKYKINLPPSKDTIDLNSEINRVFNNNKDVKEIILKLENYEGKCSKWASDTLTLLCKASPTSLMLTFQQISNARNGKLSLKECLKMVIFIF